LKKPVEILFQNVGGSYWFIEFPKKVQFSPLIKSQPSSFPEQQPSFTFENPFEVTGRFPLLITPNFI
jgi:hypothetical protein